MQISSVPSLPVPQETTPRETALREAALRLEATVLRGLLSEAGLGRPPAGFGGGAGEDHFASLLLDAQAERLARAGGIGLAESIIRALSLDGG
ncbi:rod-binding protein [Rubellimicrobium sp. CFH 75288]|uniref:rod-binding protein n=1 Tax=Rubellimicrobium sp. CFH 75288 TaxID=2697034 RepID=UPI001411F7B5|nr:rod-binding protein [Rubellimicrobium sp. CFH 75288]NAZ37303.1 flagellar biosynthesis protein FlgJ [Rubellimicrobium sp. CFH 75288]